MICIYMCAYIYMICIYMCAYIYMICIYMHTYIYKSCANEYDSIRYRHLDGISKVYIYRLIIIVFSVVLQMIILVKEKLINYNL